MGMRRFLGIDVDRRDVQGELGTGAQEQELANAVDLEPRRGPKRARGSNRNTRPCEAVPCALDPQVGA